jgi:hypothetical protein
VKSLAAEAQRSSCRAINMKNRKNSDTVESRRFGPYELKSVPIVIYSKGTSVDQSLGEYGAVAGSLFLQNFIVTFNFRSKVVVLEHV